jgi:ADP-heptose:LPS heptosyltransferase
MSFSLKRIVTKSRTFRFLYWLLVLNWFDLQVMRSPLPEKGSAKKCVIFVKMDGIGDYVIWTAVFENIRKSYPSEEYERILVGNDRFQGLAEDEPTFDKKIFVDLGSFVLSPMYRHKMLRQVRDLHGEIIVNARSTRDFLWADSVIRCSAAREKIGSDDIGSMVGARDETLIRRWYTRIRPMARSGDHELTWHSKFLDIPVEELSIAGVLDAIPLTELVVEGDYAVFFVGAQSSEKCWPSSCFGEVADHVSREYGLQVVLCGGADAQYLVDGFKRGFRGDSIDFIGSTAIPLRKVVNLIRSAKMVVANDTGAAHLSVFAGRPSVVVAPGNQYGRYFPYPETASELGIRNLKVIQRKDMCIDCNEDCKFTRGQAASVRPCLATISIGEVIAATDDLYASSLRRLALPSDP